MTTWSKRECWTIVQNNIIYILTVDDEVAKTSFKYMFRVEPDFLEANKTSVFLISCYWVNGQSEHLFILEHLFQN